MRTTTKMQATLIFPMLAVALLAAGPVMAQGYGTVPAMPGGSDPRLNPTGPSPTLPPGTTAPMPPGSDFRLNPTGPQAGAPPGYVYPMPGGRGSFNPSGPTVQRGTGADRDLPRYSTSRRSPSVYSGGRAEVGRGLQNCIDGYSPKRGLSKKEHRALCNRIWKNKNED